MIKPFPGPSLPKLKPKRLPERKAVTIIAGFKSPQGIIVCADTQETVGNLSKRNVPKVRFEPSGVREHLLLSGVSDLAVAFCGAANNGPFIDKIVDRAWEAAQHTTSIDEACLTIENSIKATYQEFGQIYQRGYCPEAELIYGVKMSGESRLFNAFGAIINEKETYSTGGIGYYMADFLASRMYQRHLNIYQCAILAAYILFQAKEHVDGCGGESQIAVLKNEGASGLAGAGSVDKITELVRLADSVAGEIIIKMADVDIDRPQFQKDGIEMVEALAIMREREESKREFRNFRALADLLGGPIMERDALGLPKSLKPQTSKDQR